uniref:Uncharacterized protein n=1 Tax=Anguilla anguilla TaxID=7936 RepID=A0A0E9U9P2_ANGAN
MSTICSSLSANYNFLYF